MRLLLLTHPLSLVLRASWLAHPLPLGLNRCTLSCALARLLSPQLLHLLASVSVAPRRLSCQVGHLPLARLLGGKVGLLSSLSSCALICDLERLFLHSIIQWLDS